MLGRGVPKQPDLVKLLTYENDLDSLCFESMASTPSWARESLEPVAVDQAAQESGKRNILGPLLDHNHNSINNKCKASVEHLAGNKKGPTLPSGRKQRAAQESARGALTSRLAPTFLKKSADCTAHDRKKASKKKVRAGKKPVEVTKGSPSWKENNSDKVGETSSNHACEEEFAQTIAPELQRGISMCQKQFVKSKSKDLDGKMLAAGPRKGKENESCEDKQNRSVLDCCGVQSMLQSLCLGDNPEIEYKTAGTPVCHECNQEEGQHDTNGHPCDKEVGYCTERRHIRFDDDGNILPHSPGHDHQSIESPVSVGSDLALPAKEELGPSKLRGLPTPKGTHVRFS